MKEMGWREKSKTSYCMCDAHNKSLIIFGDVLNFVRLIIVGNLCKIKVMEIALGVGRRIN